MEDKQKNEVKENNGLTYVDDIERANIKLDFVTELLYQIFESPEYKLLYGKTQMFYDDSGRSRGGHSRNIAESSGSMTVKAFDMMYGDRRGDNETLYELNRQINWTEAVIKGLSHDLGHTPLGHDGESVLDKKLTEMMENATPEERKKMETDVLAERSKAFGGVAIQIDPEKDPISYEDYQSRMRAENGKGIGYEHNEQSALIFSRIFDENMKRLEQAAKEGDIDSQKQLDELERMGRKRCLQKNVH